MNLTIFDNNKFSLLITLASIFFGLERFSFSNTQEVGQKEEKQIIISAQREMAECKIHLGINALRNKKYLLAFNYYKEAIDELEKPKAALMPLYQEALYLLNNTAVLLILEYLSFYKYDDAKHIASVITNRKYFFDYPPKNYLLPKISHITAKKTITFTQEKLETLETILLRAIDFYQQENWKSASDSFHEALRMDPNNDTSLIGLLLIQQQEKCELKLHADEQQNEMLEKVDQSWQLPISSCENVNQTTANLPITNNIDLIRKKIDRIIIPNIEFIDTPLQSSLEQIRNQAFLLDSYENDSNKKGINIVLACNLKKLIPEPKITLSLVDTPLHEILKYVTQQAHMQLRIDPYSIAIIPENEPQEILVTKDFRVPSDFISQISASFPSNYINSENKSSKKIEALSIKDILLSQGITFPPGATAHFLPSKNILVVKNSPSNINLIGSLVENSFPSSLKQVEIEARFLEVKQNNSKERGVNWLLGVFQLGNNINSVSSRIENKTRDPESEQHFLNNSNPNSNSTNIEKNLGQSGISAHALETLLFGNPAGSALGMLTLAGVLSNNQFQVILRAINQHKGVDLLSAPKVTVSSGKKATIRVAREFPYPADYSPPQIPQNQGTSVNPAIPTTPSSFKKRNVGVELEVKPIVDANNNSIELSLSPEIVEFQGFVNYGNPIFSQAPVFLGGMTNVITSTTHVLLTQNNINQPVFSVREVNTQVVLHDGQTVVLGGLMREDIKKVEEKIPVISSIPIAGSLFRSSSEQKIKRNLLIFVTVHLLDPSGKITPPKQNPSPSSRVTKNSREASLTRIFHTDSSRGAANPDADKEGDGLRRRLYVSYCPRSNSRLTQYPSGVRKPQQNRYEICGLTRIFHTDRDGRSLIK
jgi:general secretion pathway protein D